jgi:HPt (histidine-containing phosphotransfer) domain-containing protein
MLGEADTRELLELFLDGIPELLGMVGGADRTEAERAAHSLKSTAKQMGMLDLAEKMAALETRLRGDGPGFSPKEMSALNREVAAASEPLRAWASHLDDA